MGISGEVSGALVAVGSPPGAAGPQAASAKINAIEPIKRARIRMCGMNFSPGVASSDWL
jgi:hypothetical protein